MRRRNLTLARKMACVGRCTLALCFICPPPTQAQSAFSRTDLLLVDHFKAFFANPYPIGFTAGDFNGDGRPDLVISGLGSFSVLLNIGRGAFGAPIHTDYKFCGPLA